MTVKCIGTQKNILNKNFQKAFYHQKKCDSLFIIYNSDIHSSRIELLEQQLKKIRI